MDGPDSPGMHFDRRAEVYHRARPPYPEMLYRRLTEYGVVTPGRRVLEIGAGTGQATVRLVDMGAEVTAVEPGAALAAQLSHSVDLAELIVDTFENAVTTGRLAEDRFDSVCVATAYHWLDPAVALPAIRRVLVSGGLLAVWRQVFGDPAVTTPFRHRLARIVARREDSAEARHHHRAQFDWVRTLSADGLFTPVHREQFRWSVDLTPGQVHDLFSTFSDWTSAEVDEIATAAGELGETVTEHYRTILAVVRSAT